LTTGVANESFLVYLIGRCHRDKILAVQAIHTILLADPADHALRDVNDLFVEKSRIDPQITAAIDVDDASPVDVDVVGHKKVIAKIVGGDNLECSDRVVLAVRIDNNSVLNTNVDSITLFEQDHTVMPNYASS
jgi:hypothetical protein